jgi:hypothetical protein
MVHEWELITYDVWGNESDGYEVNDLYRTNKKIKFDDSITNKELENLVFDELGMDGSIDDNYLILEDLYYFIDLKTHSPLFELRKVVVK